MRDDDEFGVRLEEAFRANAGFAPRGLDLARTARRRVRRRRTMLAASAAVAGVIAFGGVWGSLGGLGSSDDAASSGSADAPNAPNAAQGERGSGATDSEAAGWRWESFGGVEVSVPSSWRYGVTDAPWCIENRGQPNGEVGRPGPVRSILCPEPVPFPMLGEHVWLSGPEPGRKAVKAGTEQLGEGWVRDVLLVGDVRIEVQTRANPQVRERILASVRQVRTDVNGCPVDHRASASGWTRPAQGLPWTTRGVTAVSICKYQIQPYGGHPLIASVRQAAAGAARILSTITAAPAGPGPESTTGAPDHLGDSVTVLRFSTQDGVREVYLRYAGSRHNGFDNGTELRRLTRESGAFMTGPLVVNGGPGVTVSLLPRR